MIRNMINRDSIFGEKSEKAVLGCPGAWTHPSKERKEPFSILRKELFLMVLPITHNSQRTTHEPDAARTGYWLVKEC